MSDYAEFLARKAQFGDGHGFEPLVMPDHLFDFQAYLVEWAVRQGRSAIFADCGLGKSPMGLAWAENVLKHTGKPVLVATPLAVSFQLVDEAIKFGTDAAVSRNGKVAAGITITNYEQIEKFDPEDFGGMWVDESSAIKSFDAGRRKIITEFMRTLEFRLLGTATAAPNDYIELGTSSEALGYLGYMDMLTRFFTNKEKTSHAMGGKWRSTGPDKWRFKGHAEEPFWRWVASWARAMRKPSDLGFCDDRFVLPELIYRTHVVEVELQPREGELFALPAHGLREERDEARQTLRQRCEKAAELLDGEKRAVAWCNLNAEGDLLTELIDGAVQVSGSDPVDAKEEKLHAFSRGDIRVLVTKPKLGAYGLNWQHCHRLTFFPTHSWEQHYQAVRRCWRFGQLHPVTVDLITTEGSASVFKNLQRKAAQADRMFDELTRHMRDALGIDRGDRFDVDVEVPPWAAQSEYV